MPYGRKAIFYIFFAQTIMREVYLANKERFTEMKAKSLQDKFGEDMAAVASDVKCFKK